MKRLALSILLAAGTAHAQSCYIDMDTNPGSGYGEPSIGFNGPGAVLPAYWAFINSGTPLTSTVYDLMGSATAATVTRSGAPFANTDSAATWGDYENFFDDYQELADGTMTYTFTNLEPGTYAIYTSAVYPGNANNRCTVTVNYPWENCQTSQVVGGALTQFNVNRTRLRAGVTHALHVTRAMAGYPVVVSIADGFNSSAVCNGIQLVKLQGDRLRMYVDSGATSGLNDGGTWQNAFTDLQYALDAAQAAGGSNCEIWVASGMYKPTTGTDRDATFSIPSGLHIYGGFAGDEETLAERNANPLALPTYLSGAIGTSATTDNSYNVVTLYNVNSNTLVDGFYVASGYANGGAYSGHGGGMVVDYGILPTIRNCDFTTNTASLGGGALYLDDSTVNVINCTFYKSNVYNGSGGAIESVGPIHTTLTLQNSRFLGNHALGDGGAIHTNFVRAEIANCLFSGNSSDNEGGVIKAAGDAGLHLKIWNSTFASNDAGDNCGGVHVSGGMEAQVQSSIFWGNTSGMPVSLTTKQLSVGLGSTLTASYNTVQGQNTDPQFVNVLGNDGVAGNFDDDCRLRQSSPCIDSGNANGLPLDAGDLDGDGITNEPVPQELNGKTRRVDIASILNLGAGGLPPIDRGCYEFQLTEVCYANCDNSAVAPVLNVQDFACYLNAFAMQDPYANCDGSTVAPALNVQDFACFLNKFAAGCP